MKKLTFRHYFMILGTLLSLAVLLLTSHTANLISLPFGADVVNMLRPLTAMTFGVGMLFLGTKAINDFYDRGTLLQKAQETSQGAAMALIAHSVSQIAVALVVVGIVAAFQTA